MKMSKRIFVCLIALAIGVSMLAVGASADAVELKYTTDNHASILEYYEEPIIFDFNYESDAADGSTYKHAQLVNVKAAGDANPKNATKIVESNGNKYLTVTGGKNAFNTNATFVNWNAEEGSEIDDFILEFDILTSGSGKRIVEIYVGDSSAAVADIIKATGNPGKSIVKLNFKEKKIEYISSMTDGVESYTVIENVDFNDTDFYHVSLSYGVLTGAVEFKLSLGEQTVASFNDGYIPYETIANVRIGSSAANMPNTTLAIDNLAAAGGSSVRSEADKAPETARAISDFIAICQNPDITTEAKVAVVSTGMRLLTVHGVTGETEEAQANVLTLKKLGVGILVDQLTACVNGVADDTPYAERVEYVNSFAKYLDLIPEDVGFMDDPAACAEAIDAYILEVENLVVLKEDSETIIAALADAELTNTNTKSYSYLKTYYDLIANCTPYLGYPGIMEVLDGYNTVISKFEQLSALGAAFTENVALAADTENSFITRYNAFVVARNSYFDDPAYPNIIAILESYAEVEEEMNAIIALCDEFILNVNRADYSQYLSAKQNALAAAAETLEQVNGSYSEYPGVREAVVRYGELVISVGKSIDAAQAYVAYVNTLITNAPNMSKTELQTAINEALELQKTGNVIGVAGVTEANIALNNMQSDLELTVGYKTQFSGLVNDLLAEKNNAAKFDIALEALGAIDNANKYEGVDSADKAKLDSAIAEYNAKIQALNNGFAKANDVACNTVSASSGNGADDANVGRVIALIKKFYE